MSELRKYGLAAVVWAVSLYCVFAHLYEQARFFTLLAVLAAITADLADMRRELAALRAERDAR